MSTFDIKSIQNRYALVPRTLVFIQKEETILFINKNKGSFFGSGKLNGLGGHIEKSEEPFEAARREICEEANIEVSKEWINKGRSSNNFLIRGVILKLNPQILHFLLKTFLLFMVKIKNRNHVFRISTSN